MTDPPRGPESRSRAERALALLLDAAHERWDELVLVGGLLPERLVTSDERHQGTTDIDIVLDLAVMFDIGGREVVTANLGGYLVAKASAASARGEPRDFYDFAYVVINAAREGIDVGGTVMRAIELGGEPAALTEVRAVAARFKHQLDPAPLHYAATAHDLDPGQDVATLAVDAVTAMRDLLDRLGR